MVWRCGYGLVRAFSIDGVVMSHYDEQRSHTEQLNELINRQRGQPNKCEQTIEKIISAAEELGCHDVDVDPLDYIIELARATVMVNDRNLELVQRYEHLIP